LLVTVPLFSRSCEHFLDGGAYMAALLVLTKVSLALSLSLSLSLS